MKREGDTKQRLLEVAMQLIWEQSYGSVGVEDICQRAGVTKGSFYFAFPSKSDLACAAFEEAWQVKRPILDQIFSAQVGAVAQFEQYIDLIIKDQTAKFKTFGKMCGCPYCSVGSELSTQDEKIRHKIQQMVERCTKYITGAVRAAINEGLIEEKDPATLAKQIYDFSIGVILQAKIDNEPQVLQRLRPGIFRLLGVKLPEPVPA
ncbi:MAG: TetR/AcrR family transcriptional regulator [Opitutales bacterium]|jgi:TetR/AcrR family transcriptional repressor of nem operon